MNYNSTISIINNDSSSNNKTNKMMTRCLQSIYNSTN